MNMKRREFLGRSLAGAGGVLLAPRLASAAEQKPQRFDPYETVLLGQTKLKMSRVCLGTGMRGGKRESNHTRMGKEKFEALIKGSYDRGVRVFDLADLYGTHPYVVPALQGIPRDRYQIISKIWFRPGGIPESERPDADVVVERFLKELKTDYIDLLLMHCVESPQWPAELRKQMDILAKFKAKGVIRAHGVSCHSLPALQAAVKEPWVDSVHARINPYGARMDGPPEKVAPVLKQLCEAGKGVVGMKIIGEGTFRNDEEKKNHSIGYALNLGCVHILNVGCESLAEVDDLAARIKQVERKAA
ncbi:MAG: aldo/keto reductase [Verrucomicrobia bacterium]|nr:aldo/keto reductase [Verrucomicrobiota bacterium]